MSAVLITAKEVDGPQRGDISHRVCIIPQVPGEPFVVQTDDGPTARQLADALADFQLFLFAEKVIPDYANTVWVDTWTGDEWEDLEDD